MQQHLLEDRFGFRSTEHSIGPSSRSNGRTDHENELQVEKSHQVDQWSAIVVVVVPYPTLHLLTHRIEHCSAGASRDERADRFYTLFPLQCSSACRSLARSLEANLECSSYIVCAFHRKNSRFHTRTSLRRHHRRRRRLRPSNNESTIPWRSCRLYVFLLLFSVKVRRGNWWWPPASSSSSSFSFCWTLATIEVSANCCWRTGNESFIWSNESRSFHFQSIQLGAKIYCIRSTHCVIHPSSVSNCRSSSSRTI